MKRWFKAFNEGSLLRRTLVHMGVFALGSFAFVTVVSTLLVSTATAILPPPGAEEAAESPPEGATEKAAAPGEGAKKGAKKTPGQT